MAADKAQRYSRAKLAKKLKCHPLFIARIEIGQRRIDVPELVILSRALSIPPEQFLKFVADAMPLDERV
ncbi:helix-turn-helix domain-containing protein [Ruegeria sp. SCSIO 43209]|uniref:helix-turn-helix domain-containing protein n=1 Tax=Ruegeria sp. SCSIO 43209 TaxID=2793010 RepID=UPI0021037122|nr:helix-turn-helix transcriptional regulator [Ruegeria sp. SCSIO 43209]